jgi:hypothetical protein
MTITKNDLTKWQAMCDSATEGPWTEDDGNIFSKPLSRLRREQIQLRLNGDKSIPHPDEGRTQPLGFVATTTQETDNFENDAAFIQKARSVVPRLIAEVNALTALLREPHAHHPAGCNMNYRDGRPCNCGLDAWNARVQLALGDRQ